MVRRTARGRILRRAGEHAGLLIAAVAAAAFVLGMVGLRTFVPGKSLTDYVYRTLQLFVVYVEHSGAAGPGHTPLALDVARFLAPAAAAAASIRALLALFGQKAAQRGCATSSATMSWSAGWGPSAPGWPSPSGTTGTAWWPSNATATTPPFTSAARPA